LRKQVNVQMFKRLFIISGLVAMALTAFIYLRLMVPMVDVSQIHSGQEFALPEDIDAVEHQVVSIRGSIGQIGTTLLGKSEALLVDTGGNVAVMCTFVLGQSADRINTGGTIVVKGVWHPIRADQSVSPKVLGSLSDCIVIE
jgi:hypothetical protein